MSALLKGDLCQVILNAHPKHGDVYLVSHDRRYFVAHKIVLIAASDILDRVLAINCDFCGDSYDDNVVVFFEGIPGDVLKNFLSLIYTGVSQSLSRPQDEFDLRKLCSELKLKSFESIYRNDVCPTSFPIVGYEEIPSLRTEFPTQSDRFMLSPKSCLKKRDAMDYGDQMVGDDNSYYDRPFKTEPEDFEDDEINDEDYYPNHTNDIATRNVGRELRNNQSSSALFFKCLNCPREFHVRKRYEKHLKDCVPKFEDDEERMISDQEDEDEEVGSVKSELFEPETRLEEDAENNKDQLNLSVYQCENCPRKFHRQKGLEKHKLECIPHSQDEVKVEEDPELLPLKRKLCPRPKVDFQYKEKRGRFYCLHPDCVGKNQSTRYLNGFQEHWLEKHAEEKEKHFPCTYCNLKFASNSIRNKHEKSVHVMGFTCEECGKQFPKNSMLVAHMNIHTGEKPFSCDQCEAAFVTRSGLLQHTNSYHSVEKKYKCDDCGKCFRFKMSLNKHKYQHEVEKDMNCEVMPDEGERDEQTFPAAKVNYLVKEEDGRFFCMHEDCKDKSQSFQWRNGFQEHWLEKHPTDDEKIFQCQYCPKKFASNGIRNRHVKFNHEYRYKCNHCDKKFPTPQILASHIRTHTGEKPYVCDTCGADFKSKPTLLSHTRTYHSDVKTQKCGDCGKCFRLKSTLRKHRLTHQMKHEENCEVVPDAVEDREEKSIMHPTPKVDYQMREENDRIFCDHEDCVEKQISFRWKNGFQEHWLEKHISEEDKIYPCSYCSKRFGSNSLRNRHIKFSHVLRFKCKLCEKKFATRQIFTAHMRTHTGEKPFVCEACGLSFSQKSYLRQHRELYHTDIKKFKCDECGELFKVRASLKKHKMHHQVSTQIEDYQIPQEIEHTDVHKTHIKIPKVDMPMREENGRFYCLSEDCATKGQSFQWINGLREHYMDKHATEDLKCFPCRFCGKLFGTNGLKNKHENMYHELRFECTQCDKRFGKKTMLLDHMRTHTGEKPFVCETCGSDFYTKGSLNAHIRQRHMPAEASKDHHCDHCGKSFYMLCALSRHIKTVHTESRPFVCEECGKNYKVHAALKRHMEFHSGVTIPCEPCNLTFHCQSNYRRHIRRKHMKKDAAAAF